MLRGIVLENFVHFSERFALDFSKSNHGPNIFVGASSTGKTVVLELIRRCMDIRLNSSLTNRCDESKTAYVFCEFENAYDNYEGTIISGMIVDRVHENIVDSDEEDEEWEENKKVNKEDTIFHKVIMYVYKEEMKFCSKSYLKTPEDSIVDLRKNVRLSKDFLAKMIDKELLSANKGRQPDKNYQISSEIKDCFDIAFVEQISNEIRTQQKENKTYNQRPTLWRELEGDFVRVLSMRGLGTFQWTKSRQIEDKLKSKNYEGTCAQAEIISELWEVDTLLKIKNMKYLNFLQVEVTFILLRNRIPR